MIKRLHCKESQLLRLAVGTGGRGAACAPSICPAWSRHIFRLSDTQHCYLHIAIHHPPGVVGGLLKCLEVGEDLGNYAQHPQHVDVCVSKHRVLLLQALPAQLHNLKETPARAVANTPWHVLNSHTGAAQGHWTLL